MAEKKAIKRVAPEVELEVLLRGAQERRDCAQQLFQAALRVGLQLRRRPLSPGERKVRQRLGIRSAFPEAEVQIRSK
jgi:hypothetical protein